MRFPRLQEETPCILDGPMGTELDRRGADTTLPLWSARAIRDHPELVRQIHHDYAEAGATLHTANTFRTNPTTLRQAGLEDSAGELVRRAVETSREATGGVILGSLAPVADCYRPDLVPPEDALAREHALHVGHMQRAGVDGYLVETMNSVREAKAAARAATATGRPVLVSFVVAGGARVLDSTPIDDAVAAVAPFEPEAILINCSSLQNTTTAVRHLAKHWSGPWGAYANVGTADPVNGWRSGSDVSVAQYMDAARKWLDLGASVVGSCCGTGPEFTSGLARIVDEA